MRRVLLGAAVMLLIVLVAGLAGTTGAVGGPGNDVYCGKATGTTGGTVDLNSCALSSTGARTGSGTMPGSLLVGTATGTISWKHKKQLTSTTVAITTT